MPEKYFFRKPGDSTIWTDPEMKNPIGAGVSTVEGEAQAKALGVKPDWEASWKKPGEATNVYTMSTPEEARAFINSQQDTEASKEASFKGDVPPTRTLDTGDIAATAEQVDAYATGGKEAPTPPEMEKSLMEYRTKYGIEGLETKLNEINADEAEVQATLQARKRKERGKTVAMNVIEGRISEEEYQAKEEMDFLSRQKNVIVNELKTKYDIVNSLMKYKGDDYTNAVNNYNTQFTQRMNVYNVAKGVLDTQKSDNERIADNARANAEIYYNNITSGALDPTKFTPEQEATLQKLEMQAGLDIGTYKLLKSKNPNSEMVTHDIYTNKDGERWLSAVYKNADGSLKTENLKLSDNVMTTKTTEEERVMRDFKNDMYNMAFFRDEVGYNREKFADWLAEKYPEMTRFSVDPNTGEKVDLILKMVYERYPSFEGDDEATMPEWVKKARDL